MKRKRIRFFLFLILFFGLSPCFWSSESKIETFYLKDFIVHRKGTLYLVVEKSTFHSHTLSLKIPLNQFFTNNKTNFLYYNSKKGLKRLDISKKIKGIKNDRYVWIYTFILICSILGFSYLFVIRKSIFLLKSLKKTGIPILIYSKTNNYECFNKLMKIGIQGYVTHQSPTETLQIAIDRIFNKDTYYCQHLISQLQDQNTEKKGLLRDKIITTVKISKREKEIIRLIRRGMPSKDIGETLGISVRTVGKHRENIMRKCNVGNVTELIYFIEKNEIIL